MRNASGHTCRPAARQLSLQLITLQVKWDDPQLLWNLIS